MSCRKEVPGLHGCDGFDFEFLEGLVDIVLVGGVCCTSNAPKPKNTVLVYPSIEPVGRQQGMFADLDIGRANAHIIRDKRQAALQIILASQPEAATTTMSLRAASPMHCKEVVSWGSKAGRNKHAFSPPLVVRLRHPYWSRGR